MLQPGQTQAPEGDPFPCQGQGVEDQYVREDLVTSRAARQPYLAPQDSGGVICTPLGERDWIEASVPPLQLGVKAQKIPIEVVPGTDRASSVGRTDLTTLQASSKLLVMLLLVPSSDDVNVSSNDGGCVACSLQCLLPFHRYALPQSLGGISCTQAAHLSFTETPSLAQPHPSAGNLGWSATLHWSLNLKRDFLQTSCCSEGLP